MSDAHAVRGDGIPKRLSWHPWLPMLAVAAVLGWGIERLLATVAVLGANINPTHDLGADYIAAALLAAVLGASILLWPVSFRDRLALLLLWTVKVLVTLGFMLLYESHYSSLDAIGYFRASTLPSADWSAVQLGRGTQNVDALAWLFARLVPNSYHALKVASSMIGLIAIYLFYRASCAVRGRDRIALLIGLGLTPSILFWSSILGKDPITLLGTALFFYGTARWYTEQRLLPLLWAVAGVGIAAFIRLWLAPIMAAPLVLLWLIRVRSNVVRAVVMAVVGIAIVAGLPSIRQQLIGETFTDVLAATNALSRSWAEGGSGQAIQAQFTSVPSLIRFLPIGMFTALFRPLPGEVNNAFGLLAGLEDAALLFLLVLAVTRTQFRELREPFVAAPVCFILVWSGIYSFISYQNLGTAVRFRLQVMPALIMLLLYLARKRTSNSHPEENLQWLQQG